MSADALAGSLVADRQSSHATPVRRIWTPRGTDRLWPAGSGHAQGPRFVGRCSYVFGYSAWLTRPIGAGNDMIVKASRHRRFSLARLGHTWASWHVQAGTPLYVLQELGSWECVEMVRKYAHLASDHLTQYVDRMSGLRVVQDGKVA